MLQVRGPVGQFTGPRENGALVVPAGEYIPLSYTVTRQYKDGGSCRVVDGGCSKEVPYTVKAGATTTLDLGDPFVWYTKWFKDAPGFYRLARTVRSIRGDGLSMTCRGPAKPMPTLRITNADGAYDNTFVMRRGSGGDLALAWKMPSGVKGPFTAISESTCAFKMISRPTVIGELEADYKAAGPLDPNSREYLATKTNIANLEVALAVFEIDTGRHPTTDEGLEALLRKPEGIKGWKGPYINRLPEDPWGRPYIYRFWGRHNPADFDLLSLGGDCREGTADDTTNRPPPNTPTITAQPVPAIPSTWLRRAGK